MAASGVAEAALAPASVSRVTAFAARKPGSVVAAAAVVPAPFLRISGTAAENAGKKL